MSRFCVPQPRLTIRLRCVFGPRLLYVQPQPQHISTFLSIYLHGISDDVLKWCQVRFFASERPHHTSKTSWNLAMPKVLSPFSGCFGLLGQIFRCFPRRNSLNRIPGVWRPLVNCTNENDVLYMTFAASHHDHVSLDAWTKSLNTALCSAWYNLNYSQTALMHTLRQALHSAFTAQTSPAC